MSGIYQGGNEVLQYNKDVNAITFVHNASPTYSSIPNGNSGTIVTKYSTNNGTSWDSTVIWTNTTNLARVPQGGLYNPLGNTNFTNTYMVAMGETFGTNYNGNWFCSKKNTAVGTTTPGIDQQFFPNTAPFGALGKKVDFTRYGFTYTQDGYVRGLGEVCNDINNTTATATYGLRGAAILKGMFIAGAFVWSYDSLIPNCILRSNGSKHLTSKMARMAWNDAGTVGYVVMLGVRAGTSGSTKGYQPIVYKTTNSGASWSLMPVQDFATNQFKCLVDRLWPVNTNSTLIVPFFSPNEGIDAAVDINDQLHIATTVVGSMSTNNDSLDYTNTFGTQNYRYPYGAFGYPTIYDFHTTTSGGWWSHIVDSMSTEGPAGTSAGGGFAYNPWAAAAYPLSARIQVSHSPDRRKIFYSWTMTDTTAVSNLHWNAFPDIYMRGFDVQVDKMTKRLNVTGGLTTPDNADQAAYFHYMANRSIATSSITNEIPFTISYNMTNDGNQPMNHYYLKGASFNQTDFTLPTSCGTVTSSINSINVNINPFDVIAFPNPSKGLTSFSLSLKNNSDVEINIYSAIGTQLITNQIIGNAGTNTIDVDLSSLSSGVYFYEVKADNSKVIKKLIIE